jgi:hypothetical protein
MGEAVDAASADAPRAEANAAAFAAICNAEPLLVDVLPAIDVVPGMTADTILTSGAPLDWDDYTGGQRAAIIGGALFEGLAVDEEEADRLIRRGEIRVAVCHEHHCAGSLAGIYTSSMPVLIVENGRHGNRAFCNLFEGPDPQRLNYGVYNETVRANLLFLQDVIGPTIGEAVRIGGPIELLPIMRRALHMGDELHSRNTAATLLFARELFPRLLQMSATKPEAVERLLQFLRSSDYFYLRLAMAAGKAAADAAHGIVGSSIVTAMMLSCREFAIRVSGLPDDWFAAPLPPVDAKFFDGFTEADAEYMGGESCIAETVGLGGFAQAAAPALQNYQGGSFERMMAMNEEMYAITFGEHPEFQIPAFGFRGTPTGIDVLRVVETGVTPVIDSGVAGKGGGQIGAGILRAPLQVFEAAADAYHARYDG